MSFASCIYTGTVLHARLRPSKHRLKYSVFNLLIHLDELQALDKGLRFLRINRWGLVSFYEKDHGDGRTSGLKTRIMELVEQAGKSADYNDITLLCYPRIFGYVFNPLSIYFCRNAQGETGVVIYEVGNTFGERHSYVIPVAEQNGGQIAQTCQKEFYVSPFVPMQCLYRFFIDLPAQTVRVLIKEDDEKGHFLSASFSGDRRDLTNGQLCKALITHPLMTLKVTLGIYWEALRIWRKRVPLHRHTPQQTENNITIIAASSDHSLHVADTDEGNEAL